MRFARFLTRGLVALGVVAGAAVVAPAPASAVDVYTTPGTHTVNGRKWQTTCSMYSSTVERCRTEIWATTVVAQSGKFVQTTGWVFNNLTYKKSPRATWSSWNVLVTPGMHVVNGRQWKTECDTAWTGTGGCRSQIYGTVIEYSNGAYRQVNKWIFNNIVHLTPLPCPVPQTLVRSTTGRTNAVIQGCLQSDLNPDWAAVDYTVSLGAETWMETAFFHREAGVWKYQARGSMSASYVCHWYMAVRPPRDLAVTVPYCFWS